MLKSAIALFLLAILSIACGATGLVEPLVETGDVVLFVALVASLLAFIDSTVATTV